MRFISKIFVLISFGVSLNAHGQDEIPKTASNDFQGSETEFDYLDPPHGGKVVHTYSKYHFEFVVDPLGGEQKVTIYLINNRYKTLHPKKASGSIQIAYADGTLVTKDLVRKEHWFYCDMDNITSAANLIARFKIRRKSFVVAHYYKGFKP